jgi:NLI interacting factor-like phosphatase
MGFECFYKSLNEKGVISVNKNVQQQKSNTQKSNFKDSRKPKSNEGHNYDTENTKVMTPKRKYNTSVIEEVDEELLKTERKSLGDKSQESDDIK